MSRLCYLIQTYHLREQVYRLLDTLRELNPNALLLVSHDATAPPLDKYKLAEAGAVLLLGPGGRGDFATVQRYLDAAEWLFENGLEYNWLVNITGQDYPLISPSRSSAILDAGRYDGYIEYSSTFTDASTWSKHEGKSRYLFRYHWLSKQLRPKIRRWLRPLLVVNFLQPLVRVNLSYGLVIGVRTESPFSGAFTCYGGSFYCTLSQACVEYIRLFCRENPQLVAHFRRTLVAEEAFLQSILVSSREFRLYNDSLRYFDFSTTSDGSPAILRQHDLIRAVASGAHFARKFDYTVDSIALNELDKVVRA